MPKLEGPPTATSAMDNIEITESGITKLLSELIDRKVRSWQACRKLVLSLQQKYELVEGRTRLSRGPASLPTNWALLCKLAQANMNTFVRAYVSFSTRCKLVQAKMNKFVQAGEFNYQMQA